VTIAVITVSDRAYRKIYRDSAGPEIVRILKESLGERTVFLTRLVPDDIGEIVAALDSCREAGWIITTGGTGPAPKDRTPEATRRWIDRELPGIAEALRMESLKETVNAVFSRGVAGMRGAQFVVNLPGSVKAARSGAAFLARIIRHGSAMAEGKGH